MKEARTILSREVVLLGSIMLLGVGAFFLHSRSSFIVDVIRTTVVEESTSCSLAYECSTEQSQQQEEIFFISCGGIF